MKALLLVLLLAACGGKDYPPATTEPVDCKANPALCK